VLTAHEKAAGRLRADIEDTRRAFHNRVTGSEPRDPSRRIAGVRRLHVRPPDLPAGPQALVEDDRSTARFGGATRRGDSRWTRADDDDVECTIAI